MGKGARPWFPLFEPRRSIRLAEKTDQKPRSDGSSAAARTRAARVSCARAAHPQRAWRADACRSQDASGMIAHQHREE